MIKEFLERRRREKTLRVFRKVLVEGGISTSRLTDDELIELVSKWAGTVVEVFKPMMLSIAQVADGLKAVGEAYGHLNLTIK